ncbi:MAG TPA: DUF2867 domain-containing protein [Lapillicoccus sp.]|nr:DUF2867 domain-containing protein [Lapillicoccus sp.]
MDTMELALRGRPAPDWADVVVETLPDSAAGVTDPARWAAEIFAARSVPPPVTALMGVRQLLAPLVGAAQGDWDVFAVREVTDREALIAQSDRHLDFRASVGVDADARLLWVTTAVWFHGWRGRTYFLPVRFLHDPVTRAMMRRAIGRVAQGTMAA